MKKTAIILSTLMMMVCSTGVIYAEQGDGKPLEMGNVQVKTATKETENQNLEKNQKADKYEAAYKHARERSEER